MTLVVPLPRVALFAVLAISLTACGGSGSNSAPQFDSTYSFDLEEDTSLNQSVTARDSDGDTLQYTIASAPNDGVLMLQADGVFTYTPNANFAGEDNATIQVSDGNSTATTTLSFNVTNVNDAPELLSNNIIVASQGESSGTLFASDADGDSIVFSVVTPPALGSLTLDSNTGEFTYSPASLQHIDEGFTVSITDGIITSPIEIDVSLQAAFATNTDKLNYYYAANVSHLKAAEALLIIAPDQVAQDRVNAEVAKGYYLAGFTEKGAQLLDSIAQNDVRGEALRSIARSLDSANQTELANTLRTAAQSAYNQYLSEKGIENISSSDATFYQQLMNDYLDAGENDLATDLLAIINLYAETIREEQYATNYGRFVTSALFQVRSRVAQYLTTFSEQDRTKAELAIDNMATLVEGIGWALSGGNPAYRTKTFYLSYLADYYYIVQAHDKAKYYAAKTLSYFTIANYDPDYSFPQQNYADVTFASSLTPVETIAGVIAGLYPNLAENPALAIIDPESGDYADALEEIFAYQIVNDLINGTSIAEASQAAYDYFVVQNNDLRAYYEVLVDENLGDRAGKVALKLIAQQQNELAIEVLNYAFKNVLTTANYIEENKGNSLNRTITGDWGCHRVITLLDSLSQDVGAQQSACKTMADAYLTTPAGVVPTPIAIQAYKNLISVYAVNNDVEGMLTSAAIAAQEVARLADDGLAQLEGYLAIAGALASYGEIGAAENYLTPAMTVLDKILTTQSITGDLVGSLIDAISEFGVSNDEQISSSGYVIYTLESAIRRQAGNNDNYASILTTQLNLLQNAITLVTQAAVNLPANELQGVMESLINVNASAGLYNQATILLNHEVNATADIIEYVESLATIIAEQDDFPASDIALIDTDSDGQPNFFLPSATEAQILASNLIADSDSDGDGILDINDTTPLGEE